MQMQSVSSLILVGQHNILKYEPEKNKGLDKDVLTIKLVI